jgi:hypothetical protein
MSGLIAGSSHVRRLEQFMLNRPSLDNFALIDGPDIHFYGISGGKSSRSNDLANISSKIQEIQPKHLILHIGGNDLDNNNISKEDASELSLKLVLFVNTVNSRFSLYSVTICQVLPSSSSPNLFPSITSDRSVSLHHPNYKLIIYSEFRPIMKAALDG